MASPHTRSAAFTTEMRAVVLAACDEAVRPVLQELADLKRRMTEKDAIITKLEERVAQLETAHDDLEQYGRRLNIRIENVPHSDGESPQDLEQKVLNNLKDSGAAITVNDVQRLHRSTKLRLKDGVKTSQVIVRLNNWKAREAAHLARNNARIRGFAIKQDLTHARRELIAEGHAAMRDWRVPPNSDPVFIYANINCQVVMRRGREVERINSMDDLQRVLAHFSPQQ